MKTKFILHGGFNSEKKQEDNSIFYKEIFKDSPDNVNILLVPFAKDEDRIASAIIKVSNEFETTKDQRKIAIKVATKDNLMEQIKLSDIIYFHGGVSHRLLETLKKYPELQKTIEGKIIAGESAGANVWGKFFYSPHSDKILEGLGILSIKICPHYTNEYESKLNNVGPDLEEVLLPEYQFKIFEK